MQPVDWPTGVPIKLQRQGYSREPQDVVRRRKVDAGPPLRELLDGSVSQRVRGVLSLSPAEADLFEAFRTDTLDRGLGRFYWTVTDNGAAVTARLAAQPKLSRTRTRRRYELDLHCEAPAPSGAALTALAALEDAGPASWPGTVPFHPLRTGFAVEPDDQVLRSAEDGPQVQALKSRAEGRTLPVQLNLSPAELAAFEAWFASEAGFGVRDVRFPDLAGGTHLGCFGGSYTIQPATTLRWAVSFPIYLEAIA